MKLKVLLLACTLWLVGCFGAVETANAQVANNTTLVGTVLDGHGAVVAGAKVTAVNTATRGRVTRRAASRNMCSRSAVVGTDRVWPTFWN